MNYSISISFLYTIFTILFGTYYCINYIHFSYAKLKDYNDYDGKTTGIIINKQCIDTNNLKCNYYEYNVKDIKYSKFFNYPSNLIINNKVNVLYKQYNPEFSIIDDYSYIKNFLIIILSLIILILLWTFLILIVIYENNYNKYIHLIFAIIFTSLLSYYCILSINDYYYYIIGNYNYDSYTIGTVINNDTIQYNIKNENKTLKYNSIYYDFKIGEKVYLLYYEHMNDDIKIYDMKSKITYIIKSIIFIIIIILLWIFLFYNIFINYNNDLF